MLSWLRTHRALVTVLVIATAFAFVPTLEAGLIIGSHWQGVPQSYLDEIIYYSQMREVSTGNLFFGNPYFLEHRFDVPLVLFGSSILASLPMFFGVSLASTVVVDLVLWGALFVALFYWLFREFEVPKWPSALGSLFAYMQSYDQIFRVSVRQEVFPFLLLFYIGLVRFLKNPEDRWNRVLLGAATGITFYIYGYLWQAAVVTLGLLALYAAVMKRWDLLKGTLLASALGGFLGAPAFIYTLWITTQPYFWESMNRWGLVNTHLPMAEVVYSGGWVGVVFALCILLYRGTDVFKKNDSFKFILLFLVITGSGLWIMQGSNLLTGKLLETGEHLRRFIVPWLTFSAVLLGVFVWRHRRALPKDTRFLAFGFLVALASANIYFAYSYLYPMLAVSQDSALWNTQQLYAKPLAWLDAQEPAPVVVWGNPHDYSTFHVPVLTKHYVLYEEPGEFNLLSNEEFQERYLVSEYFDNPTTDDLRNDINTYVGRAYAHHIPATIDRAIKICRIFHFYEGGKNCGTAPTAVDVLGSAFFDSLEKKFVTDIKPNIQTYLKKYHVSYILKDLVLDPQYHPEELGARRVYSDGRYELYRLE